MAKTGMTAEELLRLPDDGKRYELVEGKLKEMAPAGGRHGSVVATLTILVGQHVRERRLGVVLAAKTGFRIYRNPQTVRAGRLLRGARVHPPGGRRKGTGISPRTWPPRSSRQTTPPPKYSPRSRCGSTPEPGLYGSFSRTPAP